MWHVINGEFEDGWHVFDGQGCEITCREKSFAEYLAGYFNQTFVNGSRDIFPQFEQATKNFQIFREVQNTINSLNKSEKSV